LHQTNTIAQYNLCQPAAETGHSWKQSATTTSKWKTPALHDSGTPSLTQPAYSQTAQAHPKHLRALPGAGVLLSPAEAVLTMLPFFF
jgi:hypothetical protein